MLAHFGLRRLLCRFLGRRVAALAPMLYHGLRELGAPVVCIESRQAYQALKSFVTHKTDRNDARGPAHLARTGFFKSVHVKSLPAQTWQRGVAKAYS